LAAANAKDHPWIKNASNLHRGDDAAHMLQRHNDIVDSLQAFCEADDLKKLALEVIAYQTPPGKFEELRILFEKMDVDDSGTISMAEFKKGMMLHPEVPQERVEQMFNDMDINHQGEVGYTEYLAAMQSASKQSNSSLMGAFNTLDADKDGYITKKDLDNALDHQINNEVLDKMLAHADAQGRINFETFKRLVLTGAKKTGQSPNQLVGPKK